MESILDLLPLSPVERVPLAESPLVLALCQVRYSPVLAAADPASVAPFQRAITDQYPVASQGVQLQVEAEEQGIRSSQSQYWQFTDLTSTWKVVLAPTFVSLETRTYTDFGEFTDRLRVVLHALMEHIRPAIGTRVGLRYVNEIRPKPLSWSDVISHQILGLVADSALVRNTEQISSLQQIGLRFAGHQGVTITHGVIPTGSTVQPRQGEQIPEGPFYLLDYDVYQEFPLPDALPMDVERIRNYVESFHTLIYRLFRWSVTDQYVAKQGRR